MLGGSSALNTFVFIPPSKNHVEAWSALGNPSWSWPSFSASMSSAYSARDTPWGSLGHGPLHVSFAAEDTRWPTAWRETIFNLGFPASMNPLSGEICGAHRDPETVHATEKLRSYAASAYLQPARSRSNLTVWTDTCVEKILFDRDSSGDGGGDPVAVGVQYVKGGAAVRGIVTARREVILSAGAIHSPRVLELSGVGNPELLQRLGIDVVVDNAHVGENLQNHVLVALTAQVITRDGFETLDALLQGDAEALAAAQDALAKGRGPLTGVNTSGSAQMPLPFFCSSEAGKRQLDRLFSGSSGSGSEKVPRQGQGGKEEKEDEEGKGPVKVMPAFIDAHEAFLRSVLASPTEASAFYSMFPGYMAFDVKGNAFPHPGDGLYVTFAVQLSHPLSRGSTHVSTTTSSSSSSASSAADVQVDPRYLSHAADVEVLARHVQQLVQQVKTTEPLASLLVAGGKTSSHSHEDLSDLEGAKEFVRKACMGAYHFAGTCSQMPRDMGGVVDDEGRVYGCRNLRVCDLSIVPILPRCNTQATAYGLAEHVARMITAGLDAE